MAVAVADTVAVVTDMEEIATEETVVAVIATEEAVAAAAETMSGGIEKSLLQVYPMASLSWQR